MAVKIDNIREDHVFNVATNEFVTTFDLQENWSEYSEEEKKNFKTIPYENYKINVMDILDDLFLRLYEDGITYHEEQEYYVSDEILAELKSAFGKIDIQYQNHLNIGEDIVD